MADSRNGREKRVPKRETPREPSARLRELEAVIGRRPQLSAEAESQRLAARERQLEGERARRERRGVVTGDRACPCDPCDCCARHPAGQPCDHERAGYPFRSPEDDGWERRCPSCAAIPPQRFYRWGSYHSYRRCRHCRDVFPVQGGPEVYCSGQCTQQARAAVQAEKNSKRREARSLARAGRLCAQCADAFEPARSDARYCSTRCRVAAHRARHD